jgi:hypothetical protein
MEETRDGMGKYRLAISLKSMHYNYVKIIGALAAGGRWVLKNKG